MNRWKTDAYDAWYATPFGSYSHKLESELVFKFLGDVKGKLVLDAGSGTGIYALELAERGARVVALDVSAEMLHAGMRKLQGRAEFVLASIEHLPFRARAFDHVVSILALCFTKNSGNAIKELKRVSREKAILAVFNAWSPFALWKKIHATLRDSSFRDARFFSPRDLKHLGTRRWDSTLFALPFFPAKLLHVLSKNDRRLARFLKPFGAFIVFEMEKESFFA